MIDDDASPHDRSHDASYRALFSHPHIVTNFLKNFVGEHIIAALDVSQMERLSTTFITASLLRRESDVLWKIPRRGAGAPPLYMLLLLEFQSRIDPIMAFRMLVYVGLIYDHLYKQDTSIARPRGMPLILPVVIYNGANLAKH